MNLHVTDNEVLKQGAPWHEECHGPVNESNGQDDNFHDDDDV